MNDEEDKDVRAAASCGSTLQAIDADVELVGAVVDDVNVDDAVVLLVVVVVVVVLVEIELKEEDIKDRLQASLAAMV